MPVLEVVAAALYAVYAAAGIQQLAFSFMDASWKIDFYVVSFASAVTCLAIANILHSISLFGNWQTLLAVLGCFLVIVYFEELGLNTGLVFGEYHFTKELGAFISPNVPALVPVLWCDVIYPSLIITVGALGSPGSSSRGLHAASITAAAASILTGFDVMCEPVSVIFGHQVQFIRASSFLYCMSYLSPQRMAAGLASHRVYRHSS